jgi:hypothetical protein
LSSYLLTFYLAVFIALLHKIYYNRSIKDTDMKLTLRKASALQQSIQETIRQIAVETTIALNQFQGDAVLAAARQTAIDNDSRRYNLTKVLYTIRAKVGTANDANGISTKLTLAACIDKRIGQLQGLTTASAVQEDTVVVNGKLEQLRNDKSERRVYGYQDTVNTGVFTADDVANFKKEQQDLKKQKQTLNDEILELNVRSEIELDENTVFTLQQEGLV